MRTDFFSSKAGYRAFQRSAAKWCRTKRSSKKSFPALGLGNEGDRTIAIASVIDPQKGEALILLSTIAIDLGKLRTQLQSAGVPNLWIPKTIEMVEQIPVLATGKLDLRRCSEIAAATVANEKSPA